jgi:hypothetical protein
VPIEPNIAEIINRATKGLVDSGMSEPMGEFVTTVSACLLTLASQIDRLRSELIARGIEVSL